MVTPEEIQAPDEELSEPTVIPRKMVSNKSKRIRTTLVVFAVLALCLALPIWLFFDVEARPQVVKDIVKETQKQIAQVNPTDSPVPSPEIRQLPIASASAARGKLAYIVDGQIWTEEADGTQLKRETNDENNRFDLSISPTGTKIAYSFFPKDRAKLSDTKTNTSLNSGVGVVDLSTGKIMTLISYSQHQNYYPSWSPDERYVSIWIDSGKESRIITSETGEEVFHIAATDDSPVSPIQWMREGNISYVENKNLILTTPDGTNRQVIATNVDTIQHVPDATVPLLPLWSDNGAYVSYLSGGALHLLDVTSKEDIVLEKALKNDPLDTLPVGAPVAFSPDSAKLYFNDFNATPSNVVIDTKTKEKRGFATYGQSLVLSKDAKKIAGKTGAQYVTELMDSDTMSTTRCEGDFDYSYFGWTNRVAMNQASNTWSLDGKGLLGYVQQNTNPTLGILNADSCSVFILPRPASGSITGTVWFP